MNRYDVSRLPSMITLGYDGENNWRPNSFDCSVLLANHPNGIISLWLLPSGETQSFPVALERNGNTVVWTPLSEEMTAAAGAFQLVCADGTDVGKSAVVMFRVDESILPGADHPAAVPSWATQTIERAESAADRAEEAADSIDVDHLEQIIAAAVEAYLIEHPVEAPVQSVNGKTGAVVLDAEDVGALPADTPIPAAVTEQTVAGWGFTKNTGTYSKPSGGIPKTDLSSDVQTSLGKADTAYQKPSGGIPASDLADGVISEEIFVAVRGTTTEAEIRAAHSDGKVVICVYQNQVYYLYDDDTVTLRTAPDAQGKVYALFVTGSRWTGINYNLALASAIPTKTSQLTNDSGFVDAAQAAAAAPVQSVNGQTGAVVLDADDVGALPSSTPIPSKVSDLTNDSDYQTAAQVQSAIAAAAELPTGGSAGDFLRKTASGAAWQTVPSAESNSFGGGS